jgi:hypothetical protein
MPKKRLNKSLQTKPFSTAPPTLAASTTAPSNHGRTASSSGSKSASSSVNDLINHLRQTQVSDGRLHRLPRTPTAGTVHPSLRGILSVPDTPPPRPRPDSNVVRPSGPTRARRIPGPPPPASWVAAIQPANKLPDSTILTSRRAEQSNSLPGERFPAKGKGSLQHAILKALASNLHWLLEYYDLHLLPTQLKQTILNYVAIYNEEAEHSEYKPPNLLSLLFPGVSGGDTLGDTSVDDRLAVTRLDLSRAIGQWLSMKELRESLYMPHVKVVRKEPDMLLDSWDDEYEPCSEEVEVIGGAKARAEFPVVLAVRDGARAGGGGESRVGSGISATMTVGPEAESFASSGWSKTLESSSLRFFNLAHLSLALSPTSTQVRKRTVASWSGLLKVAPSLSRLSSLSLAYWPSPTLTPHAASTYTTIKNPLSPSLPGIPYGGSDMYTSYDGNWSEAANLLKILSRHLYCLQWLDLTGCGDWFAALSVANGAEWNGAWRGIEYVGLGVGWSPDPVKDVGEPGPYSDHGLNMVPFPTPDAAPVRHFFDLTDRGMDGPVQDPDEESERARKIYYYRKAVEKYMEILSIARGVASSIRLTRSGRGKWIEFDLSPELPAVR